MRARSAFSVALLAQLSMGSACALHGIFTSNCTLAFVCALLCELATVRVFLHQGTSAAAGPAAAAGRAAAAGVPVVYVAAGVNVIAAVAAIALTPPALLTDVCSPAALAVQAALCWLGFDYWYAQQDTAHVAAFVREPGAAVPNFELQSPTAVRIAAKWLAVDPVRTRGAEDGSEAPVRRTPTRYVCLVFLRGNWCTVCMAQINAFVEAAPLLKAHDVALYFVSSQPILEQRRLQSMLKHTPYGVLHDEGNAVARAWGLLAEGVVPLWKTTAGQGHSPDAAIPSALLLERDGVEEGHVEAAVTARLESAAATADATAGAPSGLHVVKAWVSQDFRSRVDPMGIITALPSTKAQ